MAFKIVPKVKPLTISFFFAFAAILAGQRLLSYENENLIISHCRKLNLQHIFSYNNLDNVPYKERHKVLDLLKPKKYCYKYLSVKTKEQLELLDQYPLKEYDVLYEVIGYKIRLYADSYNRVENSRSESQGKLLIGLLGFNVAALATQAIFLQADSKEIDD
tara:strand:- start:858 stop:1340 length:483 start_codon:yes stop_codon:yes gene_type:complete